MAIRQTNSRVEFQKRVQANKDLAKTNPGQITPDAKSLITLIDQSNVQLSDATEYVCRDVSGRRTIKMLESFDDQRAGSSNIANAKLSKDRHVCVTSLILLAATSGVAINDNVETLASLNYGSLANIKGAHNAVITITHAGKTVVHRMPLSRFIGSDQERSNQTGEVVLDNPFMLSPQVEIEAVIDSTVDFPQKTAIKLMLCGTRSIPK